MTACRMPALAASMNDGVEKLCPSGEVTDQGLHPLRHVGLGLDDLGGQLRRAVPVPHAVPDAVEEHPRERVVDQRVGALGVRRARGRHTQRRRPDTFGDFPAVVIGSRHAPTITEAAIRQESRSP